MIYKNISQGIIEDIDEMKGIVTGYFSSFNNIDSDGDVILSGAYKKTVAENGPSGRNRIMHLLQHNPLMPLAKPMELIEDGKETPDQIIETTAAPTTATTAKVAAGAAQEIAQPQKVDAATVTTATATPAVTEAMKGVTPAEGVVSEQAKVKAETMEPTATAVGQVEAAQLAEAQKVQAPAERKVEAGEMVTGTGVDMAKAEQVAQQTAASAAQGVVTEEMTVQGQLNKVLADFDAGNPPPWAAATMRAATAQLAARGLSASSMAGQAVIQAAMEAAVPIASQDAKVFQEMGMQNLSNRQQTAVLAAQQRAAFLEIGRASCRERV